MALHAGRVRGRSHAGDDHARARRCPIPSDPEFQRLAVRRPKSVMAMTDHLTGDHRLVNFAAHFTEAEGTLSLSHVEDDTTFARYMEAISKISTIDTDTARQEIRARLLKDPSDYIETCREGLAKSAPTLTVESVVTSGTSHPGIPAPHRGARRRSAGHEHQGRGSARHAWARLSPGDRAAGDPASAALRRAHT